MKRKKVQLNLQETKKYNMKIIKRYIYVFIPLFFIVSCWDKETKINSEPNFVKNKEQLNIKDIKFKKWLADTIKVLKTENNKSLTTNISNDSLSLVIDKKYRLYINPIKRDTIKNDDVVGVLAMLDYDRILPKDSFNLNFEIFHFYDVSPNEKKYEYEYEIKNLELIYNNKKYIYKYIKGNLIDTKIIDL